MEKETWSKTTSASSWERSGAFEMSKDAVSITIRPPTVRNCGAATCLYVCTYKLFIGVYICDIYLYSYICVCIHVFLYACVCVSIYIYRYRYVYINIFIYIYLYIYIYDVHINIYVCMYVHIYVVLTSPNPPARCKDIVKNTGS